MYWQTTVWIVRVIPSVLDANVGSNENLQPSKMDESFPEPGSLGANRKPLLHNLSVAHYNNGSCSHLSLFWRHDEELNRRKWRRTRGLSLRING